MFPVQDVDTLKQVLQRIQEFRADGIATLVIIELAGGVYHLSAPLLLAPDVLGRGLTLKGDRPGEVRVSGGKPLSLKGRNTAGNWRFHLPSGCDQIGIARVLVIDGRLQSAARYPKERFLRIERALEDRRSGFFVQEGDLSEGLDVSRGDCDLVLLHDCPCTGITLGWIWIDSPVRRVRT